MCFCLKLFLIFIMIPTEANVTTCRTVSSHHEEGGSYVEIEALVK